MPRPKLPPGEGMTYVHVGLRAEELDIVHRTAAVYRCTISAAVRMLIHAGANHTPHTSAAPDTRGKD